MPVFSTSKKISAKPLILDEPKKFEMSVKIAKNEGGPETQTKPNKTVTRVNIEKSNKKIKTNDKKLNVQKKFTQTANEAVAKRKTIKIKQDVLKNKAKETARNNSEVAKNEIRKSVSVTVSRTKPTFNTLLKNDNSLSKATKMKQAELPNSKVPSNTIRKRAVAGANVMHEAKQEANKKIADPKKDTEKTKKAENKFATQKKKMRKIISDIENDLLLKREKFAKQKEISEQNLNKKEKLPSAKDVDKKKPTKIEQKKKGVLSQTTVELKGARGTFAKVKVDIAKEKQKVQKKSKPKNIEVKKAKPESSSMDKVVQKSVKFEENIKEKLTNAGFSLENLKTLEEQSYLQYPLRHEAFSLAKEPVPAVVPRPDLIKFVQAMKENVQYESLHPGSECYQDMVHNTLKSVFSTVNKFPRKDPNDPFVKMKGFVKENERKTDAKNNSKLSAAAQMFQRRAQTVQTTQPLDRALKESQFAEERFLVKRKTQTQPEKSKFLSSLHVGPKISTGNKEVSEKKASKDDLKTVASDIVFPVDPLTQTYDTKAVKMAQRYSNQLEEARLELSRRLNAL